MKRNWTAYKTIRGTNDHVWRITKGDKPRLRAYLCSIAFLAVFSYLGQIEASHIYTAVSRLVAREIDMQAYAPTKLISPLAQAYAAEPAKQVAPTHEEYIRTKSHEDILLRIWNNESSQGKNTFQYCDKRGMTNEFGFGVTLTTPLCFKTFEDAVDTVNAWFDKQLKTHTLAQSLLLYSGNSDSYISNFLNK